MPEAKGMLTVKTNRSPTFKNIINYKTDKMRWRVATKLITGSIDLGRGVGTRASIPHFSHFHLLSAPSVTSFPTKECLTEW